LTRPNTIIAHILIQFYYNYLSISSKLVSDTVISGWTVTCETCFGSGTPFLL